MCHSNFLLSTGGCKTNHIIILNPMRHPIVILKFNDHSKTVNFSAVTADMKDFIWVFPYMAFDIVNGCNLPHQLTNEPLLSLEFLDDELCFFIGQKFEWRKNNC